MRKTNTIDRGEVPSGGRPAKPAHKTGSCLRDGHHPGEAVLTSGPGVSVRAVIACGRCGAYITSFEGTPAAVERAAASSMHGLRFVPV